MEQKSYYNQESIQSNQSRATKKVQQYSSASGPQQKPQQVQVNLQTESRDSRQQQQQPQSISTPNSVPQRAELPATVPKLMDQPNSFPYLGGYERSEIQAADNLGGAVYDLGKDGAFNDYSVLVMMFINFLDNDWPKCAGAALKQKGFKVTYCKCNEVDKFLKELKSGQYKVVWILSSGGGYVDSWSIDSSRTFLKDKYKEQFLSAVISYHKSGGGLFLWGDNEPYYYEMNLILKQITEFNNDEAKPSYIQFSGNTFGNKVLSYGDPTKPGEFDKEHLIFSGINYLYEGVTICYPVVHSSVKDTFVDPSVECIRRTVGEFDVLATSSNGKPVILKAEKKKWMWESHYR